MQIVIGKCWTTSENKSVFEFEEYKIKKCDLTKCMKIESLLIATQSLIDNGNRILDGRFDEMFLREYTDTYAKTKLYFSEFSENNPKLTKYINRLPELNCKTFRNPYYLFKTYLMEKVKIRYSSGQSLIELFPDIDTYPARNKYMLELTLKINEINIILKELNSDLKS
jgi:hypothetical protein